MRRETLDILRCTKCLAGSLVPQADIAEPRLVFGPVQCIGCGSRFPVGEGMIDLVGERAAPSGMQKHMESDWLARAYERYLRPAVGVVLTRGQFDRNLEYLVYRSLLGRPSGPLVDLGCGTGMFSRRLARELPDAQVIGVDVSKPMLEEAIAQTREDAVPIDFVRAEVPGLPLQNASVSALLHVGSLHYIADVKGLLSEVARTLKPRGLYVASTLEDPPMAGLAQKATGMVLRSEAELRSEVEAAGLVRFEKLTMGSVLVIKAERP